MTASTILFTGPSLSPAEAASLLCVPVDVRLPVRRGDLDQLPPDVRRVAIIDGLFFSEQAVSPREVLDTLRRGVEVIGSSSMGALRAAELAPFGMRGVGEIYRRYAEGEIDSDAEVALVLNPETGAALTEPLVNVRYMVDLAVLEQVLTAAQGEAILARLVSVHYCDLTRRRVTAIGAAELPVTIAQTWIDFAGDNWSRADLKRADALRCIDLLNSLPLRARGLAERYPQLEDQRDSHV